MADYIINWIDDTGTSRDNTLTVEEDLVRINLHTKTVVNGMTYDLWKRHKFIEWRIKNTAFGNVRGYYEAIYLDNGNPREEIPGLAGGGEYQIDLPNDIRISDDWTKLEKSAMAANEMCQNLFDSKDVFNLTSNKPDIPLVFILPTLFTYSTTTDTGGGDGTITVTPRGGTGPFEVKLGAGSESWVSIAGNSHTFTGLTAGGGNNGDGSWQLRVRDSRPNTSKILDVTISITP